MKAPLPNGRAADTPLQQRVPHRRPHRLKSAHLSGLAAPLTAFLLRRRHHLRLLLLVPFFYASGLLMCVCTFSLVGPRPLPGSVYRSDVIFARLWPEMQADGVANSSSASSIQLSSVWKHTRRLEETKPCTNVTLRRSRSHSPAVYLIVEANGGLNQQRSSICNAVAVAGLLNAILVVPHFQFHSVWKDPSNFGDIYDEDHFIRVLERYVKIVKELPDILMESYDHNMSNIPILRVRAWAPASYYKTSVLPLLNKRKLIRIAPFANRLAMEVSPHIQMLRCLTNYKALRFSDPIRSLASKLVARMIKKSSAAGGKYISVHLRFEMDMVAFSCCEYDGGEQEKREMDHARERGWRGKFRRKGRVIAPGLNRINGKCPLTPLEVGMMLRGMGFDNSTYIYLASGNIYQSEKNLAPLLQMFPFLQTKESLSTPEELAPFKGYLSRLAALDYTVCLHSEVFVTTQGGNFPHFLMGHRRYLYNGHAKTIKPDKRKLVQILHNTSISWKSFKDQMEPMLLENDIKGVSLRKHGQSIYAYPSPECMCSLRPSD